MTLGGISWHVGLRNRVNNLTAKSGLTGLTRGLAAEFSGRGITVNIVAPGMIDTVLDQLLRRGIEFHMTVQSA